MMQEKTIGCKNGEKKFVKFFFRQKKQENNKRKLFSNLY